MRPIVLYSVVAAGVLAVSTAAVLIRLADAPALAIAAYRLSLASLVTAPLAMSRDLGGLRSLSRSQFLWCMASALAMAIHFVAWFASLDHTSVASSVVIVTASPLLIAVVSHVAYRERLTRPVAGGIALGVAGGLVLASGDRAAGGGELYGDFLALIGAVATGAYFLIGRRVRRSISNVSYIGVVYLASAVALMAAVLVTGTPLTGFSEGTYWMILLLTLVPQLIGHSSLNWALGHLSATLVAVAVMAEPVGATILAWLILDEAPPLASVIGGTLVLLGVYLAFRRPVAGWDEARESTD